MSVINTNISAQYSQDALKVNAKAMGNVMQQLATGNRINAAKDDAAGLSITQNMTSQIRGLNQAVRNVNDGINLLQTADGALVETAGMLQRMRELAVQGANGTNNSTDGANLQTEFAAASAEITRIETYDPGVPGWLFTVGFLRVALFKSPRAYCLPCDAVTASITRSRLKLPGFWRGGKSRKLWSQFPT